MTNTPRILAASLSLVIAALGLVGCAGVYRTPGAEAAQLSALAVLEHEDDPAGVSIVEVDGKRRGDGYFQKYELTPGRHAFKIGVNIGIGVIPMTMSFKAVAGE